jgi:hypothetical protein
VSMTWACGLPALSWITQSATTQAHRLAPLRDPTRSRPRHASPQACSAKAGLRTVDKAVLLGALLEVAALDPASDRYKHLKEKGREAFQREAGG